MKLTGFGDSPNGDPPGARAQVQSPGWVRLSRGMVIRALIEARLFGKKLLTLDADIAILPARTETRERPRQTEFNGHPGAGLVDAARSLESGAADLRAARQQMP